jgi:hypothetical protein
LELKPGGGRYQPVAFWEENEMGNVLKDKGRKKKRKGKLN